MKSAVKFAVTFALLFVLYRRIDLAEFKAAAAGLEWFPLVLFFPICAVNTALCALRWRALLRADGIVLPFGKLFASYLTGAFFSIFMPSNIGGDVYRIADVAQRSEKPVNTTVSVFADRLAGFIVMSLMGVVFPLIGLRMIQRDWWWLVVLSACVFACFIAAAFVLQSETFVKLLLRLLPGKWRAKADGIAEVARGSFRAYMKKPRVLAECLGFSFVFQMGMVGAIWCVGESFGLGIPFFAYCVFVPLVNLLESVPWTVYGMGMRDAGYTMFFTAVACVENPVSAAAVMSVVYVVLTLVYASSGGVVFLFRRVRC